MNPAMYFVSLRDERSAQSRLDDIIGSEIRIAVARHELIEVDPQRQIAQACRSRGERLCRKCVRAAGDQARAAGDRAGHFERGCAKGAVARHRIARCAVQARELQRAGHRAHPSAHDQRATQIAQGFRSEGEGKAASITGKRDRDLREIESTAYRKVQEIQGAADAEATRIYAEAFQKTPQAAEFYGFMKTMETYKKILLGDTSIVLSTDSELFRLLKNSRSAAETIAPVSRP